MKKRPITVKFVILLALVFGLGSMNQSAGVQAASTDLHITLEHDQLTMLIHDAPLVDVVEQLAQTLLLTSHVAPGLEEMVVNLTVKDVSVRQGLDQLLANTNYVLTDRDLYVWARGEVPKGGEWRERKREVIGIEPPETQELSEADLQYQAIYGEDPESRSMALERLTSEGEESVMPTLVQALQDRSPEVRGLALELLGEVEGPLPLDQIAKIVTHDPDPEQRMEAIVVLASRDDEGAQAILHNALNDSDPEVVELAKSILEEVNLDSESEFDDLP